VILWSWPSSVSSTYVCPLHLSVVFAHRRRRSQSGKSALINSLLRKSVLPLYKLSSSSSSPGPTTTTTPLLATMDAACGKQIQLVDTPGFSWSAGGATTDAGASAAISAAAASAIRARDILLRNKGRIDRLKDPAPTSASPHLLTFTSFFTYYTTLLSCCSRIPRLARRRTRPDATLQPAVVREEQRGGVPGVSGSHAPAHHQGAWVSLSLFRATYESPSSARCIGFGRRSSYRPSRLEHRQNRVVCPSSSTSSTALARSWIHWTTSPV
jgi:hypothetical protein